MALREVEISGLAYSSKSVAPGTLFFCVPGFKVRRPRLRPGRRRARRRGARRASARSAWACPRWSSTTCARRWARRRRASTATRRPTLSVVGVTGTNGKTTTAFLIRAPARGRRPPRRACSAPSSRSSAGREERGRAHHARGDRPAGDLPRDARRAATAPARWRSPRTRSSCGARRASTSPCRVFTNLTQDHLDFHQTMEAYFAAKRRLFERAGGPSIVNVDDEYGRRLAAEMRRRRRSRSTATPTTARATSSSTLMGSRFTLRRRPTGSSS